MQILQPKPSASESSGVIFLEVVFRQTPGTVYTDMAYLKQTGPIMLNDFRKETKEYFKEILKTIWYDKRDLEEFDSNKKDQLTNSTNRREMYGIFMQAARDIADAREKSSEDFWAEF
ncbi:MAG TPA: hypothetical protein VNF06_02065 [Candidatus Aquilonibacter sp.]|nr:hypothetical protein [Candidatus Aquilonibacter sp.]